MEGSCAFASWFQLLLPDATFGTPDVSSPQQLLMLFATSNSPCFRPLELIYIVEKIGLALIRVGARVTGQVFKNESRSLTSIMLNLLFTIYCTCGTVLSEGMASSAVNFSYERKHSGRPHKSRASSYRICANLDWSRSNKLNSLSSIRRPRTSSTENTNVKPEDRHSLSALAYTLSIFENLICQQK